METTTQILISKKVKRVSLQRYLWSRIAFEKEATFRILGALMINQLWLEHKAGTDAEFRNKFGRVLETSSSLLKELNLSSGFSTSATKRLSKRIQTELEGFLVPKRNYPQWKQRFDSSVVLVRPKSLGVPNKTLKPKRFIGLGYGDKGTAKKPELDGSHSWQVVAQSNQVLRREFNEELDNARDKTKSFKERLKHSKQATKIREELGGSDDV